MSQLTEDQVRQIEAQLSACLPAVELARRFGITRQALNRKPDHVKHAMGGIKTPAGWVFQLDRVLAYRQDKGLV